MAKSKKTKKVSKKKSRKIVERKATKKELKEFKKLNPVKKISQELVIRVAPQTILPTESDLVEPLTAGGNKMALTKTWVSSSQLIHLVGKTPQQFVYTRPGKGGQKFTYVSGNYIIKALNFVFGWNWDFEVIAHGKEGDQVWVQGKLTVKSPKGDTITKTQFGRADIKFLKGSKTMLDFGNDLKGATTDSMKKCASLLGIASDIYGKAEFKEETGKDVTPPPTLPNNGEEFENVIVCQNCDSIISQAGADFSKRLYGKQLCRDCCKGLKSVKK